MLRQMFWTAIAAPFAVAALGLSFAAVFLSWVAHCAWKRIPDD
jgi:hypothetical protein